MGDYVRWSGVPPPRIFSTSSVYHIRTERVTFGLELRTLGCDPSRPKLLMTPFQPKTPNSNSETLNPKPQTLNSKPQTLNLQLEALYPEPKPPNPTKDHWFRPRVTLGNAVEQADFLSGLTVYSGFGNLHNHYLLKNPPPPKKKIKKKNNNNNNKYPHITLNKEEYLWEGFLSN